MTRNEIIQSVKSLPRDEQIDLALALWEAIDLDGVPITDAQRRELDRRIAADDADTRPGEPWEELRAKLLRGEF